MNTKKILLWSAVLLVLAGLAVWGYLWWTRPQTIVLSDGTRLTLLGVTYGKKHVSPLVRGMPKNVRPARITTTNDMMYVWFYQERKNNNWPFFDVFAYDSADLACVGSQGRLYGNGRGHDTILGFNYTAFPRHGRKIILRLSDLGGGGRQSVLGQFVIANPDREGKSSLWRPLPLPIKESDGDLDVTLTRVEYDANAFFYGNFDGAPKDEPRSRGVLTAFNIEQNGETVTNWQAVHVETTDASGNKVANNNSSIQNENGEPVFVYQWGLWPDESAWKLRMEFSRTSGFNPDEVWPVNEIPIEKGDINNRWQRDPKAVAVAEGTFGGSDVKLFSVKKFPATEVQGWGMEAEMAITATPDLDGSRLTILKLTDEKGHDVPFYNSGYGNGQFHFGIRKLGDIKSVNATIAIHRSRFVEFIVKPPVIK